MGDKVTDLKKPPEQTAPAVETLELREIEDILNLINGAPITGKQSGRVEYLKQKLVRIAQPLLGPEPGGGE